MQIKPLQLIFRKLNIRINHVVHVVKSFEDIVEKNLHLVYL